MCLCAAHHRAHHRGGLGITGDAQRRGGLAFFDHRGRPWASAGRPEPPTGPPEAAAAALGLPTDGWVHPSGERFDGHWPTFNERAG